MFKNMNNFNISFLEKKETGFGLVDTLVALAFLMGSVVVLTKIAKTNAQINSFKKATPIMVRYNQQLMIYAKDMLLDTKDSADRAILGICQLTKTRSKSGLGYITVSLFPEEGKSDGRPLPFSESRWKSHFPGWNLTDKENKNRACDKINNYNKCFDIASSNRSDLSALEFKNADIAASIAIVPMLISPEDDRKRIPDIK